MRTVSLINFIFHNVILSWEADEGFTFRRTSLKPSRLEGLGSKISEIVLEVIRRHVLEFVTNVP